MEKNETRSKVKLGIFVSVGLLLFIVAIYLIGNQKHLFSRTITISGIFKDISGLQVGNNVRFSGINVGTVDDIVIVSDSTVRVDMTVKKTTQEFIKKDAIGVIGSEGLMGSKVLNIFPGITGSQEMIQDKDIIATRQLVSFDDIMVKMDAVAANATVMTEDLSVMVGNIRAGKGLIGKLLTDEKMAQTIDQTMTNVEHSTAALEENLEALKSNFLFRKGFKKKEEEAAAAEKAKIKAAEDAVKAKEKAAEDAKKTQDKLDKKKK
jgi:phospholipid/cholesterol/gamma-HCH transport system substrate-binding protein